MQHVLHDRQNLLALMAGKIASLSPLDVLTRGYTITLDAHTGEAVRSPRQLHVGQQILTRFAVGIAKSRIEATDAVATEPG